MAIAMLALLIVTVNAPWVNVTHAKLAFTCILMDIATAVLLSVSVALLMPVIRSHVTSVTTKHTDIPTITAMHALVVVCPVHKRDAMNAKKTTTYTPTVSPVMHAVLAVLETVTVITLVTPVPRVTTNMLLMDTVMVVLLTVPAVRSVLHVMSVNLDTGFILME